MLAAPSAIDMPLAIGRPYEWSVMPSTCTVARAATRPRSLERLAPSLQVGVHLEIAAITDGGHNRCGQCASRTSRIAWRLRNARRWRRRFSTSARRVDAATALSTIADVPDRTSSITTRSLEAPTNGTSRTRPSAASSAIDRSVPLARAFAARAYPKLLCFEG